MNEHAAVFGEVERAHVDLVLIEAHSVRVRVEQASQLDQTLIEHGPCLLLADGAVEQRQYLLEVEMLVEVEVDVDVCAAAAVAGVVVVVVVATDVVATAGRFA